MTKLLEKAIERIRELPDEDQDVLAVQLLAMAASGPALTELDDRSRAAIQEGLEQARRADFAADEEIAALWKRHDR